MNVNKLIVAVLGLSLLFIGCGSAIDHVTSTYGHQGGHNLNHDDRGWNHNGHDWLSGESYWYPSTYYYNYYTPLYTYTYPTYYYTEPVYYNVPVVYNSYIDPWWGANIYGFGSTYYSSSSHWTYNGGFGFGYP